MLIGCLLAATIVEPSDSVYLATYFTGNGETGAYLAVSEDGYKFRPIVEPNVAILKPQLGPDKLMRDSCLLRAGGKWHMVWTTGWWDQIVGLASSKDLLNWGEQTAVPAMTAFPGTINAWAPEIAYDAKTREYMVFWSSTIKGAYPETSRADGDTDAAGVPLNHRYYATTSRDLKRFAPTKLLWDPGFNCIDATLMPSNGRWLLFGKDETKSPQPAKFLFVAESPAMTGPFSMTTRRITGDFWAEGPTAVQDGKLTRMYFDRYTEGKWGAVESTELETWTDVSDRIQMVPGARHGTVLRVDRKTVDRLAERLKH